MLISRRKKHECSTIEKPKTKLCHKIESRLFFMLSRATLLFDLLISCGTILWLYILSKFNALRKTKSWLTQSQKQIGEVKLVVGYNSYFDYLS